MSDSNPVSPNNARLAEFVYSTLGNSVVVEDKTRLIGKRSLIWRITRNNDHFWLKAHNSENQFKREKHALLEWVPLLGEQSWWSTPDLLADSDELQAIVISEVPGGLLDSTATHGNECSSMFEMAGRFARLLHDTEITPEKPIDPVDKLLCDANRYLLLATDHLDSRTIEWVGDVLGTGEAFADVQAVPAHMDYSPRNWFIDRQEGGIRFGVIDWERSQHSIWAQDVARMAFDHWQRDPSLRESFFEGYGHQPTEIEDRQVQLVALVNMVGGVPYAVEMNDEYFEALCRRIIELLKTKIQ
jgi:thiamine kinase-like enzyme